MLLPDFPILLTERPYSCYTVHSGQIVTWVSNVGWKLRTSAQQPSIFPCFNHKRITKKTYGVKGFLLLVGVYNLCTELKTLLFHIEQFAVNVKMSVAVAQM